MILGYNFFKWCIEDVADEKDVIIILQQNKICLLKNRLKVSTKKIKMLLLGMCFLYLINIIMLFHFILISKLVTNEHVFISFRIKYIMTLYYIF